jgi:hypothetical protein
MSNIWLKLKLVHSGLQRQQAHSTELLYPYVGPREDIQHIPDNITLHDLHFQLFWRPIYQQSKHNQNDTESRLRQEVFYLNFFNLMLKYLVLRYKHFNLFTKNFSRSQVSTKGLIKGHTTIIYTYFRFNLFACTVYHYLVSPKQLRFVPNKIDSVFPKCSANLLLDNQSLTKCNTLLRVPST